MSSKSSGEGKGIPVFRQKAQKRALLWDRQNGLCYYCKRPMRRRERTPSDYNYPDDATLDHKTPRSAGGTNNIKNMVLSCFQCNSEKGDSLDESGSSKRTQVCDRASGDQHQVCQGTTATCRESDEGNPRSVGTCRVRDIQTNI